MMTSCLQNSTQKFLFIRFFTHLLNPEVLNKGRHGKSEALFHLTDTKGEPNHENYACFFLHSELDHFNRNDDLKYRCLGCTVPVLIAIMFKKINTNWHTQFSTNIEAKIHFPKNMSVVSSVHKLGLNKAQNIPSCSHKKTTTKKKVIHEKGLTVKRKSRVFACIRHVKYVYLNQLRHCDCIKIVAFSFKKSSSPYQAVGTRNKKHGLPR